MASNIQFLDVLFTDHSSDYDQFSGFASNEALQVSKGDVFRKKKVNKRIHFKLFLTWFIHNIAIFSIAVTYRHQYQPK